MAICRLDYPVHTLDHTLLLPAGTVISPETLSEMVANNQQTPSPTALFLKHGSIEDDLLRFIRQIPYQVIFGNESKTIEVLKIMGGVRLPIPILESLDYFLQYDPYTYRHILMVFAVATLIAQDLVKDLQDRVKEAVAGPAHDFGKICVPLSVLRKTGPLTRDERMMVEHHALAGYVLLIHYFQDVDNLAAKVARDHHERRNGSGYPAGIHQTDPMVEIIIASDIFDALVSARPYRPDSFDNRTALEEITIMAENGAIGWKVVQALIGHNREGHVHYSEISVPVEKRGHPPAENVYGVYATSESDGADQPYGSHPQA